MFTGLIEAVGRVETVQPFGGGLRIGVDVAGLRTVPAHGASVAVDGACLTVTELRGAVAVFEAVTETAERTTLRSLRPGDAVNLESALRVGDPLDGHLVLGHVDAVGTFVESRDRPESRVFRFTLPPALAPLVAEKGSVAVQGVSLTVVEAGDEAFSVSLIPETLERSTLGRLRTGARVNLEADVLARYVARLARFGGAGGLTEAQLRAFVQSR